MTPPQPTYSLKDIYEAARNESITFRGRSDTDFHNLGYSLEDVADCLCSLDASDYIPTDELEINGLKRLYDVYVTHFETKNGQNDELYIKLKLSGWLLIASFHISR